MAAPESSTRRTPLERAPLPDLGHSLIPKERYTSEAFARLEREGLWNRVWLMAGFESDLAEPGDYFTVEIGPESVLVVRQDDGGIHAFHNVCMHRGNRLREPGQGRAKLFECGYHAWRYGRDGVLIEPQDEHTFPQGCPRERLSLRPVRCELWGGFVWLNLEPDAEPLVEFLGVIPEHLDPYHFEEMKILDDHTVEVDCNWKTSVDAFNEAYHIAGTHPDTLDVNDDVNVVIDCYERHTRMILKLAVASPRHPEHGTVTQRMKMNLKSCRCDLTDRLWQELRTYHRNSARTTFDEERFQHYGSVVFHYAVQKNLNARRSNISLQVPIPKPY